MISPRDLCTVAEVKEYISPWSSSTKDDALLQRFIARASGWIEEYLARSLALAAYTEQHNGTNTVALRLRHGPIVAVQALSIGNGQVQPALATTDGISLSGGGYLFDEQSISLRCRVFTPGIKNVLIQYQAGYLTPGIFALTALPAWQASTPYAQGAQLAPAGAGVVLRALNPGQSGATPPFWPTEQSTTVTDGAITWVVVSPFLGIVPGARLLPEAISLAACELVALQYRQRGRIGDTGIGVGPERVTYFMGAMSKTTQESLKPYRDVTPPWDLQP